MNTPRKEFQMVSSETRGKIQGEGDTTGREEPSLQVGRDPKVTGTGQMKGGQEKVFQVEGTGRAKVLRQERAGVLQGETAEGRAEGGRWDRVGRGRTTQACGCWIPGSWAPREATEGSGREGYNQFTFRKTFSGPRAYHTAWHTVALNECC